MKGLDARSAMSAQSTHVRARTGRDQTTGASPGNTVADPFEIVFRRMKDNITETRSSDENLPASHVSRLPRVHSPPAAATGEIALERVLDREEAARRVAATVRTNAVEVPAETIGTPQIARTESVIAMPAATAAECEPISPETLFAQTPTTRAAAFKAVAMEALEPIPDGDVVPNLLREAAPQMRLAPGNWRVETAVPQADSSSFGIGETIAETAQRIDALLVEGQPKAAMPSLDFSSLEFREIEFVGERAGAMHSGSSFEQLALTTNGGRQVAEPVALPVIGTFTSVQDALPALDAPMRGRPQEANNLVFHPTTETPVAAAVPQAMPGEVVAQTMAAGRELLVDQIVQAVRVAQHNESTEVIVQLKPDFLGRLSIRVLADDHGMRVEIRAGSEAVRQVMQDNLADLEQRLQEKGFAMDQFSVFTEAGSHSQREPAWSLNMPAADPPVAVAETPDTATVQPTSRVNSGVIDYFA